MGNNKITIVPACITLRFAFHGKTLLPIFDITLFR